MASKRGSLGYCYVVCALLISYVSLSSSTDSQDDWLEYSLAAGTSSMSTSSAIHVERSKRQAEGAAPASTPSPSGGGDSSATQDSVVTTTGAGGAQTDSNMIATTPTPPAPTTTPWPATAAPPATTAPPATPRPATTAPPATEGASTSGEGLNATIVPSTTMDNHSYYMSTIIPGAVDEYFVPLTNSQTHNSLNSAHRLAGVISLPFNFRFYGHTITNITVATGGFIYMSPFLHRYLARTQYVAPLMANFHTAASNDSNIFFQHIGDEFVIEWQKVLLKDEEEKGPFIFQAKLKKDGTITFVYKNLPVPLPNISTESHPLKIGLSDAFYNDTYFPAQKIIRRRIIEYHRVVFSAQQIEQGTVVILSPLPTCNVIEDCKACALHTGVKFDCQWCSNVGRCSDGLDWYRQNWEKKGCKTTAHADSSQCNITSTTPFSPTPTTASGHVTSTTTSTTTTTQGGADGSSAGAVNACGDGSCNRDKKNTAVAAAVTVSVLLVLLLVAVGIWGYYAYTHPTSPSGIWLMEHRPSVLGAKMGTVTCCKKKPPPSSRYAMESTA